MANFPDGLLDDFRGAALPRRPLMVRAALLRRSCDGVAAATESLLRRRCADQLRRAHSARRVRNGADAARVLDGADAARSAAATELRRRTESLL